MPRKMRVEYPGVIHHVLSRGDRREDIFLDDVDRQDYLKTLAEACQKTGFEVQAYCLMRNPFHWVAETPNANLVAGLAWPACKRPWQVGAGCAVAPGNHPATQMACGASATGRVQKRQPEPASMDAGPPGTRPQAAKRQQKNMKPQKRTILWVDPFPFPFRSKGARRGTRAKVTAARQHRPTGWGG